MLQDLITNKYFYLHVHFTERGTAFYLLVCKSLSDKKKGIVSEMIRLDSLEELSSYTQKKAGISLLFTGKGLVHKLLEKTDNPGEEQIQSVIPGVSIKEVYYQHFSDSNHTYLSFSRKSLIDVVLQDVKNMGMFVDHVFLGKNSVFPALSKLQLDQRFIRTIHYDLQKNKDSWEISDRNESNKPLNEFKLGEINIPEEFILCAFLLNYPGSGRELITNIGQIENNRKAYRFSVLAKQIGLGYISFIFVILLANFLVFDSINKNHQLLALEHASFMKQSSRQTELNSRLYKYKSLYEEYGNISNSKVAWYFDRLALSMPQDISLKRVEFQPAIKESGNKKTVRYNRNLIQIEGIVERSTLLNEWMFDLGKQNWIEQVKLIDYTTNELEQQGLFLMEISFKQS
ncbi:MAG: hypothetical protein JEZ03_06370 [Bacteroidales bacterium]|nr:hypothetical protein [Bacteroidales bacterium]